MAKFSSRLRNNIFLFIIFIIILLIFVFSLPFIFKEPFLHIKNVIEKEVGSLLDKEVSIERIYFLPYGELVLYNLKIYDGENIPYVNIRRSHIKFRLLPLLIDRAIVITEGTFIEPIFFSSPQNLRILQNEKKNFDKYKLKLDRYLALKVKSGKVIFAKSYSAQALDKIGFSFYSKLKEGNRLYSRGWIDLKEYRFKNYLLNDIFFFGFVEKIGYKLRASLFDNTFLVDDLLLDFEQFKIEAKGLIENYNTNPISNFKLTLKELNFPEKACLKSKLFISNICNFIVHITGALKESRWAIRLDKLRGKFAYLSTPIKIDNFHCNLRVSKDRFLIDDFRCFLNNFPIGLKCELSNFEPPYVELSLISYPGQLPSLRSRNPLNFGFAFSGYKYKDSIRGKTFVEIERFIPTNSGKVCQLKFTISDLLCKLLEKEISYIPETSVPLLIEAKNIVYESYTPERGMRLNLTDFASLLYPEGTKIYFADLNLSGYEGFLKGNGFLDFENLPPRSFLEFKFNDFNMAELAEILYLDCDLAGALSGEGTLDSKALSYLAGRATILNGYIKNLKLLDLIADFFNIISLKNIYFEDFFSKFSFSVTGDKVSLDKIRLRSEDIYLSADFKIRDRREINGDMLVRLSTKLLEESFKLKRLLLLTGEKLPFVDFEFKIGGFIRSPRIKWLDTEFKENLTRYLSKREKETMEKKVEEAIKPLLESK